MVALEQEIVGIERGKDFHYFLDNALGIWHGSIVEDEQGEVAGFLHSVRHPASNMVGPGVMRTGEQALAVRLDKDRARIESGPFAMDGIERARGFQTVGSAFLQFMMNGAYVDV